MSKNGKVGHIVSKIKTCHNTIKIILVIFQQIFFLKSALLSSVTYDNSFISAENASYASYEEASQYSMPSLGMETSNVQWTLDEADALQSIAFRYSQNL